VSASWLHVYHKAILTSEVVAMSTAVAGPTIVGCGTGTLILRGI